MYPAVLRVDVYFAKVPPFALNPEMNPTSTLRSVLFWLVLAGLTFALLVAGYGTGFWK